MPKLDQHIMNKQRKKIGGKWKPLIIFILYVKPERFNKIKQLLPGISSNVLAKNLKEMEIDLLVARQSPTYALTPVTVKIASLIKQIQILIESIDGI